jgi:nitrogen PTS system EIIA component
MHLRDYLDPSLIFTGLASADKQTLLDDLATLTTGRLPSVAHKALLDQLRAREKESSTGVGQGVAIPHCFLEGLDRSLCILAQVPQGVAFDAIDEKPVYILFMLLSPPDARMAHLRLLARISRIASREGFLQEATEAASPEALYELMVREDHSHAG